MALFGTTPPPPPGLVGFKMQARDAVVFERKGPELKCSEAQPLNCHKFGPISLY